MIERSGFGDAPAVSPWTTSYRDAYEPHPSGRYDQYVDRLRKIDFGAAKENELLELAINLCVEGEAPAAADVLARIDDREWPSIRRAALLRLVGAVHREMGATRAAVDSYSRALAMLGPSHAAAILIEWDLFELDGELDLRVTYERQKELLSRQVPLTPAYLMARSLAAEALSKELFEEGHRSGGTHFRFRTGMPEELAWHNTSLAVAYITGDYGAARDARREFGSKTTVEPT